MRKKYLSALLFGALLFASAGTFTSCKDYDDDINGLRTEITDLKSAITELQNAVQNGKYVTAVSGNGNVITFTFSDGTTTPITVEAESGEPSQTVTIGEDGEVIINGEGTGYYTTKTPTEAEVEVGLVKKGANGTWEVLGEDGEYTDTKIPVSGITVAGSEAEGYTFTIVNANGETQEVKLPSAASAITSIDVELIDNTPDTKDDKVTINQYDFDTEYNKKRWKDLTGKDITSNEIILTSGDVIAARLNPVDVDATLVSFSLTNSKNETLPGVVFKASEYKDYVTSANTRAGYGNGLYTLAMQSLEVKNEDAMDDFKLQSGTADILYALNAANACRGKYVLPVTTIDGVIDFTGYTIDKSYTAANATYTDLKPNDQMAWEYDMNDFNTVKFDAKVAHTVTVVEQDGTTIINKMDQIYDMWLSAEDYDVKLFDLTFDQEKHTFTVNADPDIITKAYFTLYVHTLDNTGAYRVQPIQVYVSNKIVADAEYAVRELTIVEDNTDNIKNKNAFYADMKTMTDGLGDQLAAWQRKVDATSVKFYTDADCKKEVTGADGIDLIFVNEKRDATADIKDAVDMKFVVTNADASQHFVVDKTYYAEVTFLDGTDELNSIVVPFEFSIPELSTLFAIRDGYVVDGVINAYFYNDGTQDNLGTAGTLNTASAAVELERYFSKYVADANVEVTGKIGNDNATDLFKWGNTTATAGKYHFADLDSNGKLSEATTLELVGGIKDGKPAKAYGEAVTVKVTKDNYYTWKYVADGAGEYSFQIRLMSPVYEGSIAVLKGERVIVSANDFVAGANITEADIEGRDYTGINNLYIFPDVANSGNTNEWKNKQIKDVTPSVDEDHYINTAVMTNAWVDSDDVLHKGVINIKGRSLSNDTDIDLPVKITDAWGYELDVTVPVTVKVGE